MRCQEFKIGIMLIFVFLNFIINFEQKNKMGRTNNIYGDKKRGFILG
jgi:hypothetical protein